MRFTKAPLAEFLFTKSFLLIKNQWTIEKVVSSVVNLTPDRYPLSPSEKSSF